MRGVLKGPRDPFGALTLHTAISPGPSTKPCKLLVEHSPLNSKYITPDNVVYRIDMTFYKTVDMMDIFPANGCAAYNWIPSGGSGKGSGLKDM